ncbi:MAG TPA: hypothetical protein VM509_01685 [Planctomycetota bacterium]|nr:hypothetical protein [Planctomycetota bacterium]
MQRSPSLRATALSSLLLCVWPTAAIAQTVNPADKQRQEPPARGLTDVPPQRLRSWELPATVVEAQRLSPLREEDRVGSYGQPRWTAARRFPTTRIYVVPEGEVEFEYWTRVKTPRKGPSTVQTMYEAEFGLPNRFQLDLYWVDEKTGSQGTLDVVEQKTEVRYAFADWGEIWGNPTIYEEYVSVSNGSDVVESKLLLGDELAPSWHWGTNLVWERQLTDELANVFELTGGVSKTLQDEKLSIGFEAKLEYENTHADRDDYAKSLEIGPSLQWRPVPAMHIDIAPLLGINFDAWDLDSRESDIYFVLGWEF